jgi:hypothetical protein
MIPKILCAETGDAASDLYDAPRYGDASYRSSQVRTSSTHPARIDTLADAGIEVVFVVTKKH